MFHRHTKAGTICRPVSGGMIPAVLLFHYFVDDCPLTNYMAFFEQAITVLQTLVIALGAGLGIWGVINLLEGYGNDNPGANAHVR